MHIKTNLSQYNTLFVCGNNSSTNVSCFTLESSYRRSKIESYLEACLLSVLMVVSTTGNVLVCVLTLKVPALRTRTNIFVVNLAIADIAFVTLNIPFAISILVTDTWIFSRTMCEINGTLFFTSGILALLDLAVISVYRYFKICKPESFTKYFTVKFCIGLVVWIWLASVLVSIPPLFGWGVYKFSYGQAICTSYWPSSVSYFVVVMSKAVFVPFLIIVFAYINIVITVLKSRHRVLKHAKTTDTRSRNWRGISLADIQLSKMSFVICIAFVVCWAPISVLNFSLLTGSEVSIQWEMLATCLMYVNTLIDPLIYAFMNGPFRREFLNILYGVQNRNDL